MRCGGAPMARIGWPSWCEDNGHAKGTKQLLGRTLKSAAPQIRVRRPGRAGEQERLYRGIALREQPTAYIWWGRGTGGEPVLDSVT